MRMSKRFFAGAIAVCLSALCLSSCAGDTVPEALPADVPVSLTLPAQTETAPKETESAETAETDGSVILFPHENDASVPYSDAWMRWFWEAVEALEQEYPDGSCWNHAGESANWIGVTETPCDHANGKFYCNRYESASTLACGTGYGTQCAGFAGLLSDRIFGKDAPARVFYDYDAIRPGDQARINNDNHSVFILSKTDEYVVVAECNARLNDCRISWGRVIPRNKLRGFYITRAK